METPPLALRLASLEEDAEPWIIEKQMFEMLVGYLDPDKDVSAKTAAIALNKLAPMHREVNDDDEVETPASFLLETWGIFIKIAKQIKYNHPAQGRLVDLIVELTKLPPVTVEIWGVSTDSLDASTNFMNISAVRQSNVSTITMAFRTR